MLNCPQIDSKYNKGVVARTDNIILFQPNTIRVIFCDVDGVITDGGMYWSESGLLVKKFNTKDAVGLHRLQKAGITVIFITASCDNLTLTRLEAIGADNVIMDKQDKWEFVSDYLRQKEIPFTEAIYVGDDYIDLQCVRNLIGVCPADAVKGILEASQIVLTRNGGEGVLSELADLLLISQEENFNV